MNLKLYVDKIWGEKRPLLYEYMISRSPAISWRMKPFTLTRVGTGIYIDRCWA
jgi:hypothetical protein